MKLNKGIVIRLLVMSLFVGVVIIAIGLGQKLQLSIQL